MEFVFIGIVLCSLAIFSIFSFKRLCDYKEPKGKRFIYWENKNREDRYNTIKERVRNALLRGEL